MDMWLAALPAASPACCYVFSSCHVRRTDTQQRVSPQPPDDAACPSGVTYCSRTTYVYYTDSIMNQGLPELLHMIPHPQQILIRVVQSTLTCSQQRGQPLAVPLPVPPSRCHRCSRRTRRRCCCRGTAASSSAGCGGWMLPSGPATSWTPVTCSPAQVHAAGMSGDPNTHTCLQWLRVPLQTTVG
jgi:hypothetical protein